MEKLIESVRKYPCLWKIDSQEYKLNDLKEAAWKEVVKECDLKDVKEARAFWKKLRDGHRQALSKKKTVTGQAATPQYTWKYEQLMEFLLPSMLNRPRSSNFIIQEQPSRDLPIQNEESNDSVVEQPYGDIVPPKKKQNLVSMMEAEQRRRQERSIERDALRRQMLLSSASRPETALDKFFNSMLLTTQSLPEGLQVKVQRQIFNIVMEAKEQHLSSHPSRSTTPNNPNMYNIYTSSSRSPSLLSDNECSNSLISVASSQSSSHFPKPYTSLPQSSPHFSNQDTSPPQLSPHLSIRYATPPQSSPHFSNQDTSPPQLSPHLSIRYATPPQSSAHFSNQDTSPPQSSPHFSNQDRSLPQSSPHVYMQYTVPPQSSPHFSAQYISSPKTITGDTYTSPPQRKAATNQPTIYITHPSSVQADPHSTQQEDRQSPNLRKFLEETNFD